MMSTNTSNIIIVESLSAWHLFAAAPKPLHLIRLNPDQINVNERRRNIYWARRLGLQVEAIQTNVWGAAYLC